MASRVPPHLDEIAQAVQARKGEKAVCAVHTLGQAMVVVCGAAQLSDAKCDFLMDRLMLLGLLAGLDQAEIEAITRALQADAEFFNGKV